MTDKKTIDMGTLSIAAAKRIARSYALDQVLVIGINRITGKRYHATYGKDARLCEDIANCSRVMDLLLSSNTPEEFILKAKGIFQKSKNLIAHGEHAVMEVEKTILQP